MISTKNDVKEEVVKGLLKNPEIVSLLGGKRIYQIRAPDATETKRITVHELSDDDTGFYDNIAGLSFVFVQVDIWSYELRPVNKIKQEVIKTMKEMDFIKPDGGESPDLYENDTKLYHKGLRFIKLYKNGGN